MIRDSPEEMSARLRVLESENIRLKRKLWKLQYRGTITVGMALASMGGMVLFLSYLYSSLILTFIGLGMGLAGLLIFYVSPSRYVREEVVNALPLSMIKVIDKLVGAMGYNGRTIFLHPKNLNGAAHGYVFIPRDSILRVPSEENLNGGRLLHNDPEGICVIAPSQSLVELFEKELSVNLAKRDLEYLQQNLPKLLIEDLRLTDEFSMESNGETIKTSIVGGSCAKLCDTISKETRLGNHLGCPLCAAIALAVSKVTGKPVIIKESNVKNDSIKTTYLTLDL